MTVKETGKRVVARTARNPVAWSLYKLCGRLSESFARIYGHARFTREIGERNELLRKLVREMFPQLIVADGPFKGMRYPSELSFGSPVLPKLLGSYESELHPVWEELLANEYNCIVDIGCAEGYYAIGLGLRIPNAEIYAYDSDSRARQLCQSMAAINGVEGRVHIGGFCNEEALRSINLGKRALVICDCEGYEGRLFTSRMAEHLAQHDIVIEAHDFIDIDLSQKMRDVFAATHQIRSVKSTDDIEKAYTYRYPSLEKYDRKTKWLILGERRPAIMEWLIMTSRVRAGN